MHLDTRGTYVIALRLDRARQITVGRLGAIGFRAGWYLYAGSAMGPGGLRARLGRHLRKRDEGAGILRGEEPVGCCREASQAGQKRIHWHIDYLREATAWGAAWVSASPERLECEWARVLGELPGADLIAPGFGSSDCGCRAHLVWVPEVPGDAWFARVLGGEKVTWKRANWSNCSPP